MHGLQQRIAALREAVHQDATGRGLAGEGWLKSQKTKDLGLLKTASAVCSSIPLQSSLGFPFAHANASQAERQEDRANERASRWMRKAKLVEQQVRFYIIGSARI